MKICYLTHDTDVSSGYGRYAHDLISEARKHGHQAIVLVEKRNNNDDLPILERGFGIFRSALRVKNFIKECDIIHAIDINPYGIIAWLANIFLHKPFVLTVLGTYSVAPFHNWKTRWLCRRTCISADRISAISGYTKDAVAQHAGTTDIVVVNPCIDTKKFSQLHEQSTEKYVLSVGALKYRKGYHISIPAFASAKKKIPDLRYKIVGSQRDVGYLSHLREIARQYGVGRDIEFVSGVSDDELLGLYRKASAFILASVNYGYHFEGFGLVFLEAAAAGLPCIGTLDNGIEDAVKNGYNGILVPQGDVGKTAEAIVAILTNKSRWQEMSESGHAWAEAHSIDTMYTAYERVYASIAK